MWVAGQSPSHDTSLSLSIGRLRLQRGCVVVAFASAIHGCACAVVLQRTLIAGYSGVTPAAYLARMIAKEGGIDAFLNSMPKARNPTSEENRRRRLEILVEGREFVVDGALGGR